MAQGPQRPDTQSPRGDNDGQHDDSQEVERQARWFPSGLRRYQFPQPDSHRNNPERGQDNVEKRQRQ